MSSQPHVDETGSGLTRPVLRAVAAEDTGGYDGHETLLDRLASDLDELLDLHPDGLQDPQIDGELAAIETAKRRLGARTVELVAVKTTRQARRAREANPGNKRAGENAGTQVAQDLADELNLDTRDAHRLVNDAKKQRWLSPDTKDAARAGTISPRHATILHDQLLRHLANPLRSQVEAEIVSHAATMSPGDFSRACRRRLGELDASQLTTDDRTRAARRTGSITHSDDGTVHLSANLAGVDAETVMTATLAFTTPDADGMPRTSGQRIADALVAMARCALDAGEVGVKGGVKPHVTVFLTWDDLANGGTAELGHTGPISTGELRTLLDDCTITRIITGPDGQPLDVGRARRTTPAAVRTAIVARDRHCTYPGCTVPPARCQAAHFKSQRWWHGAPTAADHQTLLCLMHHQLVDRLNLTARIAAGQVLWDRPTQG